MKNLYNYIKKSEKYGENGHYEDFVDEAMSDTKMKLIGKLLNKVSNKEIKTLKELDKIMKSIQCKRITKDCEPNENGDFNAGYNNGKYSFRVFIKDNKINDYTDL